MLTDDTVENEILEEGRGGVGFFFFDRNLYAERRGVTAAETILMSFRDLESKSPAASMSPAGSVLGDLRIRSRT